MLDLLTYVKSHGHTEVSGTDKNKKNKRSYDFTVCLPFWDALTGSQQQMLRLNTIVRSYRAGDNVIFSMPEKNGLFLVLSGGLRLFIATDTGREITLMSIVSGGCCVLNTLDSAVPGDTVPILQASSDAVFAYINIVALRPLCAESSAVQQFLQRTQARNVQTVLNNIEYYFFHPLRSCIARVVLEKGRRAPRGRLRAHYPRRDLPPPRHHARGHQQGAGGHASDGPSANRPRKIYVLDRAALEGWPIYSLTRSLINDQFQAAKKQIFAFWQLFFVLFHTFQLAERQKKRSIRTILNRQFSDIQRNQVVMFNYRQLRNKWCSKDGEMRYIDNRQTKLLLFWRQVLVTITEETRAADCTKIRKTHHEWEVHRMYYSSGNYEAFATPKNLKASRISRLMSSAPAWPVWRRPAS